MEQILDNLTYIKTLDELINYNQVPEYYDEGEPSAYTDGYKIGVQAGAQWQKEQDKDTIDHLSQTIEALKEQIQELRDIIKYP